MKHYENQVLRNTGTTMLPVSGATVTVYLAGTVTLATLYSDDGVTPISNPVTTDANGGYGFYVADGLYDIQHAHASITTYTLEDVDIFDRATAASSDAQWKVADLDVSAEFQLPTVAPGTPAAGDLWEAGGVLKHGASSVAVADLATEQTFTKSQTITATVTAGKVALTAKGNATAAADILDIYDSAGTPAKQSWFDSTGLFGTNLNLTFKSGTANTGTLDHAITADRIWTLPDAAGTFALTTAIGTGGTDVAWSAAGGLSIPSASGTARGLLTTGAQTIAGAKSFTGNMDLGSANTFSIGDTTLSRSAADTLQLATGDKFVPQTDSQDLGTTTKQWSLFTDEITLGADVVLNRASANVLQLATGDSFLPQTDSQDLGTTTKQWSIFTDLITVGADVVLSRSAANTLQLATGDLFVPQTDGQDLGTTTKQWSLFTDEITVGADVVLSRSAANTLQLATGDKLIPQSSGQDLGVSANRWVLAATTGDFSGAVTISSTLSAKDLTEVVATTNVITAAESGLVSFLDLAAGFVSTLPAPAAGLHFSFIVKTAPSGGSYTIVTDSSVNNIVGHVLPADGIAGDTETSGADTITFVTGTAVKGDQVELWCDGTNWYATGRCAVNTAITFTIVS